MHITVHLSALHVGVNDNMVYVAGYISTCVPPVCVTYLTVAAVVFIDYL